MGTRPVSDRPFVFLNVAMSLDGKTDTIARGGAAISSPQDRVRVDQLRASSDAVMVGGRTLLGDDPKLTVKSAELRAERQRRGRPENPAKVGIVTRADLRPESHFLSAGPARIFIITTEQSSPEQIAGLRALGVEVVVLGENRVDLPAALHYLKQAGVDRLMVEGGGTLNEELLRLHLIDELSVYIAPLIFGGATAPTFASGPGFLREEALALQLTQVESLDGGVVLHYRAT